MTIHLVFTEPRLLVGWRRCDYHDVWYEPILTHDGGSEQKADGTFKMQLTLSPKGEHKPDRDPDPEEVLWYPQFDWKNCEAEGKNVQKKMQRKILYDAWRFCMTTDEHQVRQLEAELENRDFVRWDSWFRHARTWKWNQMKRKGKRRASRKAKNDQARRNGVSNEDIEQSLMETSEEDEAYETDLEEAEREKAAKKHRGAMAPPLPPANPSGGQRRGRGTGPPPAASKKRARPGAKAPRGSAGLPSRSGRNTIGSNRPIVDDTEDEDDDEDDATTVDFDPRPPEGPSRAASMNAANVGPTNDYDGRDYLMGSLDTPRAPPRLSAASIQGLFVTQSPSRNGNDAPPRNFREGSVFCEDDLMNGGVDEDEAVQRAMRESMQRDEDDITMQRAMAASAALQSRENGKNGETGENGGNGEGGGEDGGERGESGVGDDSGVGLE